jgi:hypothetical protein
MNQSEQINELAAALAKAQTTMKVPEKDCNNPYFKSQYASLESIGKASLPSLRENGLAIIQGPDYKEGHMVLVTKLIHTSGQWIESYAPLLPAKQDSQGVGAAITYMKRYAWSAMVGLAGADADDDGNAERERLEKEGKPKTVTREQANELESLINGDDVYKKNVMDWLKKTHKVSSLDQMPVEAFVQIRKNALNKKAQEEQKIQELAF